jgi:hypothetical protein
MNLSYHPFYSKIAYVDVTVPHAYALQPGASSNPDYTAFRVYFSDNSTMDKSNDWSLQGIDTSWRQTTHVSVYDLNGRLIYGQEFLPEGTHNHAPTGISLSDTSVFETKPVGTVVGTFTALDVDANDPHTFSLVSGAGDPDNASFTIDGNKLKTATTFDYHVKNRYYIRVRTTDSYGQKYEKTFVIRIKEGSGCTPGDGTTLECAYQLDGLHSEEITINCTGKGEYWIYCATWPYMNDPWWTPDIRIYLNHAGVIIPSMTVIVNGTSYYYGGGWYKAIDIPDHGPYTIHILCNGGPFKFKLSN